MIRLNTNGLVVKGSNGQMMPCSTDQVTLELFAESDEFVDKEIIRHAAVAVLLYFRNELKRTTISVGEFSMALEQALKGLGIAVRSRGQNLGSTPVLAADLRKLASESGKAFELCFFPRLREEVRDKLSQSPRVIRFQGLRGCVKQLAGARRWTDRCQRLNDHIVDYLRLCWSSEVGARFCALVVE